MSPFSCRPGTAEDAAVVVALFDEAIEWMTARGATGQWGSEPFSADRRKVESADRWASGGGLRVCELAGDPVAVTVLGGPPSYVEPADEPELYVVVLLASRRPTARGAGRFLLRCAEAEARAAGIGLLRVDCYAGNDGALVRYYEGAGFTRVSQFRVGQWPGWLLERRPGPPRTRAKTA